MPTYTRVGEALVASRKLEGTLHCAQDRQAPPLQPIEWRQMVTSDATSEPGHLQLIYSPFCCRIAADFTSERADVPLGGGQADRLFVSFLGRRP